jgi:hypothetical protein
MLLILALGALSIVLALILTLVIRDRIGKLGFLGHPDGVRKKHAPAVPRVVLTMAGRIFLRGGFQRIIDFETRLVDFEKTLAGATGIEECWIRIRSGRREFGFQGVRMNFEGLVFEDFEGGESEHLWELRIPLAEAREVNFFQDVAIGANSIVLSAFATAVEHGMRTCIERRLHEAAAEHSR